MRTLLLILVSTCISVLLFAQDRVVSGVVTADDTKETVPQANIIVKGTTMGTVSDLDGNYSITVPDGYNVLVFSFVGYEEQEIDLSDKPAGNVTLNVVLSAGSVGLNTVVVSASKHKERVLDAPASVTVINSDKITSQAPLTVVDNLQNTPGVDIIHTGLVQSDVNVRGFNNIFSGALLTIVDNRIARVPSLRVNVASLIPGNSYDIERIEVVRGPGSALYGPNASDGVLAIFTKSPLDMDKNFESTVAMSVGNRSLLKPEARIAAKLTPKLGIKVSGSYTQAHDFEYYDPREPSVGDSVIFGTVQNGMPFVEDTTRPHTTFDRDFFIQNYNVDGRLDYRPNENIDLVFSGGLASLSNIELTGLGAGQGIGWHYFYGQFRFRYKDLFIQYFVNGSNSGDDTYLIPQVGRDAVGPHNFQLLIDRSKQHVVQIQHNWKPISRLSFVYGVDALITTPNTEGTINGRFENDDNIVQVGGYVQGEVQAHEKLKFVGAIRVDKHNFVDGVFVSPRVAMVYKPTPRNTLRLTYNRAFSSPTSLNLSLDLSNGLVPNGINIRGIGNRNGYNYRYGDNGMPQFISPATSNWYDINDKSDNHIFFDDMSGIIAAGLGKIANLPSDLVTSVVNQLFTGITGDSGTIQNVDHVTVDYIKLLESGSISQSQWDVSGFRNYAQVKNSVTQTMELGYKGILWDKVFFTADLYYTRVSDYVSPLTLISAGVVFNESEMIQSLGAPAPGGLLYDNIENLPSLAKDLLTSLLDDNPDYADPSGTIPSISGTVWDEIAVILAGANRQIPLGSVTPDDQYVNADIILPYVNLGTIDVAGFDLGMTYQLHPKFAVIASYSFVNKDRIPLAGAQDGYVALNAPRNKTSVTTEFKDDKIGLVTRLTWRWQDGFPANSAVYVGNVKPANFLDLNVSYKTWFERNLQLTLSVSNLLNYKFQSFPGTPQIGTIVVGKVAYTF